MDRGIDERNRASLDRLRDVAARLSEDELLRPIDPPWTAAALFAHIAFWDRFAHARWVHAANTGGGVPGAIDDDPLELVNEAGLPGWTNTPARIAIEECMAAAETMNSFVASLEDDAVSRVVESGRERLVDRSIHRREHLGTMERAFPNL
jgi:hypothetical protein